MSKDNVLGIEIAKPQDVTVEDLVKTYRGHAWNRNCPGCGLDCGGTALIDIVYTCEICTCNVAEYPHLVETTWHKQCYDNRSNKPNPHS